MTATEPMAPLMATEPTAPVTAGSPVGPFAAPPVAPYNPALPPDVRGDRASRLPIVLAAAAAFVVVLGLLTLLARDDTGGTGTFDGEVAARTDGRHEVTVSGGSVVVVRVEPDAGLDAVVGFELAADDAGRVADVFAGSVLEPAASPDDVDGLAFRRDVGFEGEDEVTFLAVPFDVDVTVVVTGFDGSTGGYEVTIERVDLDVDDSASGDDLVDAVVIHPEVPLEVRRELAALLGE